MKTIPVQRKTVTYKGVNFEIPVATSTIEDYASTVRLNFKMFVQKSNNQKLVFNYTNIIKKLEKVGL